MYYYSIVSRNLDYIEIPWLQYCLSKLMLSFSRIDNYSELPSSIIPIFLVSQNCSQSLNDYFSMAQALVREKRVFGLIHISDEWYLRANYDRLYDGASFVIRNYYSPVLTAKKVLQLPLGANFSRLRTFGLNQKSCYERTVLVHFSGELKYSRIPMMRAMEGLGANHSFPTFQSYDEYLQHMSDTRFVLCPNGNTTPDTYRLYEALMLGCIPIVERGLGANYLSHLFEGSCPIKSFSSWRMARKFIEETSLEDSQKYRISINEWWSEYLKNIPTKCHDFVLHHTYPPEITIPINWTRNQSIDFFRHLIWLVSLQNPYALRARALKMLVRRFPMRL